MVRRSRVSTYKPKKYREITTQERDALHKKYWDNTDPLYIDSDGTESFKSFVIRTNLVIVKMKKLKGLNYIFTHGSFIRCAIVLLTHFNKYNSIPDKNLSLYLEIMKKFKETYLSKELEIKNVDIFELTKLLKKYKNQSRNLLSQNNK